MFLPIRLGIDLVPILTRGQEARGADLPEDEKVFVPREQKIGFDGER